MEIFHIYPRIISFAARVSLGASSRTGGGVGLYLVKGERYALIDTGVYNSPEVAVAPALTERGLGPADIDFVLNIRGHAAHTGATPK